MKTRTVLFFTLLALVITLTGACATTSPVNNDPESFLGEWSGTWRSSVYSILKGNMDLAIRQLDDGSFKLVANNITNSKFTHWSAIATFKDEMLVVDQPRLKMELRLYEDGRQLEATYDNNGRDIGVLWLTKKTK